MKCCSGKPLSDNVDWLLEEVEGLLLLSLHVLGEHESEWIHLLVMWNDWDRFWGNSWLNIVVDLLGGEEGAEEVLLLLLWCEHLGEEVSVVLLLVLSWQCNVLLVLVVMRLEHSNGLLLDILEELLDSLEEINEVWEHQTKLVHMRHLTEVLLKLILEHLVEGASLDMLSLNRLIPLGVNSIEISHELSVVGRGSVNFGHKLLISIARVVLHEEFVEVESNSHDLEHLVEESVLKTLEISALTWVLKAEVLHVITNLLELAYIVKLIEIVNDSGTSILPFVHINFPEGVLMSFLLKIVNNSPGLIHPVTEAFVRDDIIVLLVKTLDGSLVESLPQFSVGLHVVHSWGVTGWAVCTLLQHTEEWLVHMVMHPFAGGGGSDD